MVHINRVLRKNFGASTFFFWERERERVAGFVFFRLWVLVLQIYYNFFSTLEDCHPQTGRKRTLPQFWVFDKNCVFTELKTCDSLSKILTKTQPIVIVGTLPQVRRPQEKWRSNVACNQFILKLSFWKPETFEQCTRNVGNKYICM